MIPETPLQNSSPEIKNSNFLKPIQQKTSNQNTNTNKRWDPQRPNGSLGLMGPDTSSFCKQMIKNLIAKTLKTHKLIKIKTLHEP